MNLVKISPNVLVNPQYISCVEQKKVGKVDVVIVWMGEKSYPLGISINEFLNQLDNLDVTSNGQFFAG